MRPRQPRGRARSDYSTPCPGCGQQIRAGQEVTRVELPQRPARWWHGECRREAVRRIVASEGGGAGGAG